VHGYLAENLPRVGVNTLLSIAVLTGLPRLRMPLRRVLGPALFVAAGRVTDLAARTADAARPP
jgi:hypothetical protein